VQATRWPSPSTHRCSTPPARGSCQGAGEKSGQPLGFEEFVLRVQDQTARVLRHERLLVVLDGTPVFNEERPEELWPGYRVIIRGRLVRGAHKLRLFSRLRGSAARELGYLRGQVFDVKSVHRFQIMKGGGLCLTVQFWLRDVPQLLGKAPALRFVEQYSTVAERD